MGILIGTFALIFIVNAFAFSFYGLIDTVGIKALNLMITQNYYVNYIQKKLKEGYEIGGDKSKKIVEEAGVAPIPSDEKVKKRKIFYYIFSGVIALFLVLSFVLGKMNDIEEAAWSIDTRATICDRYRMWKGNVFISKKESGLPKDSVALVHQIIVVDKFRLKERLSKLPKHIILKIEREIDYVTKD